MSLKLLKWVSFLTSLSVLAMLIGRMWSMLYPAGNLPPWGRVRCAIKAGTEQPRNSIGSPFIVKCLALSVLVIRLVRVRIILSSIVRVRLVLLFLFLGLLRLNLCFFFFIFLIANLHRCIAGAGKFTRSEVFSLTGFLVCVILCIVVTWKDRKMDIFKWLGFNERGGHHLLCNLPPECLREAAELLRSGGDVCAWLNAIYTGGNDDRTSLGLDRAKVILRRAAIFLRDSIPIEDDCFSVPLEGYGNLINVINTMQKSVTPFPKVISVLFHGAPGTGKSHFTACARRFCVFQRLTTEDLDKTSGTALVDKIYETGLLIDEVDEIYEKYPAELHALLDDAHNGKIGDIIVVMTTNNFNLLKNTPLVRPGRVDRIIELGAPTEKDVEKFFSLVPKPVTRKEIEDRVSKPYTMAKLGQAVKDIYMEKLMAGELA
jgi:hypothetical protein